MPIREQFPDDVSFQRALRDWFAGQALAGFLAHPTEPELYSEAAEARKEIANACYLIADGMIAERTTLKAVA